MPSSNPAFGRGFARSVNGQSWGAPTQYGAPGQYGAPTQYDQYGAPNPYAATTTRYLTMDDVVTKTGVAFIVTVLAAAATWALPASTALGLAFPAALVGMVVGLVISFRQIASPVATLAYAAIEGVFLGGISEVFNQRFPGVPVRQELGNHPARRAR